jgi:hypothetical protein
MGDLCMHKSVILMIRGGGCMGLASLGRGYGLTQPFTYCCTLLLFALEDLREWLGGRLL